MRFLTAILASAFAASAWAAPPALTLPPEIPGEPVAFVEVRAKTDGKWVRYVTLDAGLAVFPSSLLSDKTVTVVVAAKPGRYRILAYTGNDDGGAEAITTLVIGGAMMSVAGAYLTIAQFNAFTFGVVSGQALAGVVGIKPSIGRWNGAAFLEQFANGITFS